MLKDSRPGLVPSPQVGSEPELPIHSEYTSREESERGLGKYSEGMYVVYIQYCRDNTVTLRVEL